MNNQQEQKSIKEEVLNRIKEGDAKMRPQLYFILKILLLVLSIFAVAFFSIYFVSFVFFKLRAGGIWFLPEFGLPGVKTFLLSLPWLMIFITLLAIALLWLLAEYFSFVYRRPILYTALGIIILVLFGGFYLEQSRLHPNLFLRAQKGDLPVMGKFYSQCCGTPPTGNVHQGVVSDILESGFRLETCGGQIVTVNFTPATLFPAGSRIQKNDSVIILGRRDDGIIQAFGIRRIDDEIIKILQRGQKQIQGHFPMLRRAAS